MSAAAKFRSIPSMPSHGISRTGEIIRLVDPAPSHCGSKNQFRKGRMSQLNGSHACLTQKGKITNRTRRQPVLDAFGETWPENWVRGEESNLAKLSENQVIEIRERHARGEGVSALAREFKTCSGNVCAIVNGRSWKHLLPGFEYASRHRHCRVSAT